jgi:hypothetical protein
MKSTLIVIFAVCTLYLLFENFALKTELSQSHIHPKAGECTIQMRNLADMWEDVIFVHGYADDYAVAKYLVDLTDTNEEMSGGRPKGSWRVKVH